MKKFFLEEFRNMTLDERRFWRHLFESLEKEGVVVVIAAGNDGAPLELDPMHESVYPVYVRRLSLRRACVVFKCQV